MKIRALNFSLALALAAAVSASPALAQGNGKGNGNGRGQSNKQEQRDERRVDRDHDRDDDRWEDVRLERRRNDRRVPPGWCIGRGNPHNTPENCGWNDDNRRRGGVDPRFDTRSTGRGGSYTERHADFHRVHDRRCRDLAAQRPLDLRWQLQVRQECAAEHQAWHRREGIAH
ncbi:MAG TPA: hypothetical protein VFX98_04530 [Longimicrobiaceae bacterium]|nr:hypothetical protein [Longimicrobiaceae bacterium]